MKILKIDDGIAYYTTDKTNYKSVLDLDKEDLYSADEVFITNSILGIMKIVQFEERSYSTSMVERIRSEYEQFII